MEYATVGQIVNTHGINGYVKVYPMTDFAQERFAKGSELFIAVNEGQAYVPVKVAASREVKNVYHLLFDGVQSINEVEPYKGCLLKIDRSRQEDLDEGEYYQSDIIGCEVVSVEGERLGTIVQILQPGANDVWVAKRPDGKELLIPVIDGVVITVDPKGKQITIEVMEGML